MESNNNRTKRGRLFAGVLILSAFLAGLVLGTDILSPLTRYSPWSFVVDRSGGESDDEHGRSDGDLRDDHDHNETEETEREGHEHESEEAENADSLALDDASLFNIGVPQDGELTLELQEYRKSFRVPGIVREIPGRSIVNIAATVSGIVTKIESQQGDSLCPGAPLLEIQLTHEEAIQCQTDLIALLQKQDVLRMEEERLGSLADGIAPKQQREILLQKISNEAAIQSQRNLLKIHGFTDATIEETVVGKRQAITRLIVRVPEIDEDGVAAPTEELHSGDDREEHYQILEKLLVNKGDSVRMGDILCQISDLRTLQIEGKAFASNENIINDAFLKQSPVAAVFADAVQIGARRTVDRLKIARIDNFIAQETQTVSCWIDIPNDKLTPSEERTDLSTVSSCDRKTIQWRLKPGQRCELAIGYETIADCFVLPPEAVATDRSDAFVFELTEIHEGKKVWTKKPVRVLYRANDAVVVANDETIRPGMKIAKTGAEQLFVALGSGSGKLQSACEHDH